MWRMTPMAVAGKIDDCKSLILGAKEKSHFILCVLLKKSGDFFNSVG
ncbi:MAG: hypothetical protein ACR2PS_12520 [Pseudomonadales bacterium]